MLLLLLCAIYWARTNWSVSHNMIFVGTNNCAYIEMMCDHSDCTKQRKYWANRKSDCTKIERIHSIEAIVLNKEKRTIGFLLLNKNIGLSISGVKWITKYRCHCIFSSPTKFKKNPIKICLQERDQERIENEFRIFVYVINIWLSRDRENKEHNCTERWFHAHACSDHTQRVSAV